MRQAFPKCLQCAKHQGHRPNKRVPALQGFVGDKANTTRVTLQIQRQQYTQRPRSSGTQTRPHGAEGDTPACPANSSASFKTQLQVNFLGDLSLDTWVGRAFQVVETVGFILNMVEASWPEGVV